MYTNKTSLSIDRETLEDELLNDEGYVSHIYLDHLGHPTFGVGHLITPNDPEYGLPVGTRISTERIHEAFIADLEQSIIDCYALYSNFEVWPREAKHVIINMMFNLGRTRLSKFLKMNGHLLNMNWKKAAIEGRDSLWYNQVRNRAERLMKRLESIK